MIEFKNVSYTYSEGLLLNNISFTLADGSFTALAGENGAGKTTMCRLAAALLRPTSGEVISNGLVTSKEKSVKFAAFTGFLFQNPDRQICRTTAYEEILFGLNLITNDEAEAERSAREVLDEFGFAAEKEIFYMSRGERQMLALASVLARHPKFIIADEPTSGLDGRQYALVARKLKEAQKNGTTVLMVTHDMELAEEIADDMMILAGGGIVAHGPISQIMTDAAILEKASLRRTEMRELAQTLGGRFEQVSNVEEMMAAIKSSADKGSTKR